MAFTAEQARIPTSLGDVSVVLTDYIDPETQDTASADIQLCESGGSIFKVVSGDLVHHMSADWIARARQLVVEVRIEGQKLIP